MANSHRSRAQANWAPTCPKWQESGRCGAPPVDFHYFYDDETVTVNVDCANGHTWSAQWMDRGESDGLVQG